MKNQFIVIFFFLSGFVLYISADDHGENAVSYDKESFEKVVTQKKQFVMFYAPWCGHCKRLAPTWDELAKLYNVEGSAVTIAKVDCTVERALCSDHGVRGYPTVKFFPKSTEEALKYGNARTIDALKAFVEEQLAKEPEPQEEGDDEEEDDEIKLFDLTADTFAKHVEKGHHFVKFFAPWCGHCKKLAPTWEQLANSAKNNPKVTIAKVDCTQHSSVCIQFNVRGYPTLLWLTDGQKIEDYRGGRSLDDLLAYVKKMSAAESSGDKLGTDGKVPEPEKPKKKVVTALTTDNFEGHIAKGDHFVKFFTPWCGHCKSLAPVWKGLAGTYESDTKVTIAEVDCTQHESVCNQYDVKGYPTLIWFRDGKKVEGYNKGRSLEDLKAYTEKMLTKEEGVPAKEVDDFKQQISKGYHFVEFYTPWCEHCKTLAPDWKTLTKDLKQEGKVTASQVDCQKLGSTVCDANGIEVYPTMVWFKDGERIDSFHGVLDIEGLHSYVKKMVAIDDSHFKTLTADTFKKAVSKSHHFVEFYTPWCEHCQTMAPRLEELAEGLKDDSTITVAKVDCEKYGKSLCDEMEVEVYPTLMWFKDGERLDKFSGMMEIEGLKKYVKKMTSLEESNFKDLTGETFKTKISKGHSFVEFFTPWCEHCKTLTPTLQQIADSYKDKLTVAKIDCMLYAKLCDDHQIEHYPVMTWYKDGKKVDRFSGVKSLEYLKEYVDKMLAQDGNPLFDLTTSLFPNHIAKGTHFVKFYAPWCGHCKRLAPVWQELADNLKSNEKITIAKVDCTAHGAICDKYGVRGYPTLQFFQDGDRVEDYSGGRTLADLMKYVTKMVGTQEEEEKPDFDFVMPLGPEDFDETVEELFTFIAFMQPDNNLWKAMELVWTELAGSFEDSEDMIVASVDCKEFKELCKKHKVIDYPTLKLFHEGKEVGVYRGDKTLGGFSDFLEFQRGEVEKHKHEHEEL